MKTKTARIILILILVPFICCLIAGVTTVVSQLHGISFQGKIAIQGILNVNNAGIFLYDRVFHTVKRITPQNMLTFSPVWSPDGNKIAFVYSDLSREVFNIAVMDVNSGKIESIINKGVGDLSIDQDTSLAWSPDAGRLLYDVVSSDSCHYLFLYNFDRNVSQALNVKFCQSKTGNKVYRLDLSWFPNVRPLIGASYESLYDKPDDIYILDQMLANPEWITHGSFPVWRPGTKDFSYLCYKTDTSFFPSICQYSLEHGTATVIIENYKFDQYTWSPDGRSILYVEVSGESIPVFLSLINLETGKRYHLRIIEWGEKAIWSSK